jgi:hypothetical protein
LNFALSFLTEILSSWESSSNAWFSDGAFTSPYSFFIRSYPVSVVCLACPLYIIRFFRTVGMFLFSSWSVYILYLLI